MKRKTRLSICVVWIEQWSQLVSSDHIWHCEGIEPQQIFVPVMIGR
jgi:hypothetical protein